MTTYLLVHGAFRGGWAWRFVRERLVAQGHDVWAPSLTGMGDRRHLGPAGSDIVRLGTWVEDIAALARDHDLTDVVLVGHSQGGLVAAAAAGTLHTRLARIVFLDAPVPDDGERAVDLNPPGVTAPDPAGIDMTAAIPPRPVGAADGFDDDLAAWANERLCPTPIAPSFDPVAVGAEAAAVPRTYAFFRDTPTSYPCWSTRARLDERGQDYLELPAGHDAPLTAPDLVVELLTSGR